MAIYRKTITALGIISVLGLGLMSSGCDYVRKIVAKDKLNQGAALYNQGNTKQAQVFFKDATDTDPNNTVAWLFYGATLVKDYKSASNDAKRKQMAQDALGVFDKALALSDNSCAYKTNALSYKASIYDDLNDFDKWRDARLKVAEDPKCGTKDLKATTYYTIASRYWTLAYDQTERYKDKAKASVGDNWHYRNMDYPAAQADKEKTLANIQEGLKYINLALAVDPEYVDAIYYKGLLYRQVVVTTKDEAKRKEYTKEAEALNDQASKIQKQREADTNKKQAAPQG